MCSDKSLVKIAKDITNCDGLWPYLKISQARHEEIYRDKDSYSNYKLNLLLAWRKECGDQATYQNLHNAFEDWENKRVIDVVNELALNGWYINFYACIMTSICTYLRAYTHTCIHTCMHACIHTYIHACRQTPYPGLRVSIKHLSFY